MAWCSYNLDTSLIQFAAGGRRIPYALFILSSQQQKAIPPMVQTTITITNKLGLHARASAKLTKLAGSFDCEVWMSRGGRRVNAKSIMGVMMLAAGMGSEVAIETSGAQEQEAMDALVALINDKFGEGQ